MSYRWKVALVFMAFFIGCERYDDGVKIEEPNNLAIAFEEVVTAGTELTNIRFHPTDANVVFLIAVNGEVFWHDLTTGETTSFLVVRNIRALRQLFDMAIHPDFESNGKLVFSYTYRVDQETIASAVSTVTINPDAFQGEAAEILEEKLLMTWTQFNIYDHTVDALEFGPMDGYLYISTGDGGCCNDPNGEAQNLNTFRGKLLRIAIDDSDLGYSIPPGNPFADDDSALDEIWAYGFRNPFKMHFDDPTGNLFIYDVGENLREEISFQPASDVGGTNYGWRIFEGNRCNDDPDCAEMRSQVRAPILELEHGVANSIIGGVYYRGTLIPQLSNRLIFADFIHHNVWAMAFNDVSMSVTSIWDLSQSLNPDNTRFDLGPVTIRQDLQGEVYVVDHGGKVYRIVPTN